MSEVNREYRLLYISLNILNLNAGPWSKECDFLIADFIFFLYLKRSFD